MNDMKCPFCQQELARYYWNDLDCYACPDLTCDGYYMTATKDMWQALINTKKKLDIAVSQLKKTRDCIEDCRYQKTNYFLVDSKDVSIILDETNEALEQINNIEKGE